MQLRDTIESQRNLTEPTQKRKKIMDSQDSNVIALGVVLATYLVALIAVLTLTALTIVRRRRVSPLLRKSFALLLVTELFFLP
jgi:cytochrome bd-type quinol oxidase subunit 1